MIIRSAFWEGEVRPGAEEHFRRVMEEEIVPALRQLPGVRGAKILWPLAFEERPASIICQILVEFDDETGLTAMLASPERLVLHKRMPELKALIDGSLSHVNYLCACV